MMKKFQLSLLFLASLVVFACSKDDGEEAPVENKDPSVGTWVLASEPEHLPLGSLLETTDGGQTAQMTLGPVLVYLTISTLLTPMVVWK